MHHPFQVKLIRLYFALVTPLFPKLAVISAHRLFHYPVNSNRINLDEKQVALPTKFSVQLNEKSKLQAFRWGKEKDPKVLLVHGWSTTTRSMTHILEVLLENSYQVISYDAPRHGESAVNDNSFTDLAGWADAVHAVMNNVGEVECIVAHSFGTAAVTMASKLGLQTKKLVYLAPIGDMSHIADKVGKHLGISKNIIKQMHAYTWAHNKDGFEKYGKNWADLLHSNFHVPTLIYHDREDKEIPIEHARLICKRWPWAKLKETTGLGHRKILDDPVVIQNVFAFIKEESTSK